MTKPNIGNSATTYEFLKKTNIKTNHFLCGLYQNQQCFCQKISSLQNIPLVFYKIYDINLTKISKKNKI